MSEENTALKMGEVTMLVLATAIFLGGVTLSAVLFYITSSKLKNGGPPSNNSN